MKIHIVGAGIIGLFSAYFLNKDGHEVSIIDQTDGQDGCSFGNAGMIVPSHFIPLAAPGMIEQGMKWMFDAESPFYIKPRLSLSLLSWGLNFMKMAKEKQVQKAMPVLRDLGLYSKKLYHDLAQEGALAMDYQEKGLLMLCKTQQALEEEMHTAELANQLGIKADVLDINQIYNLEKESTPAVNGGVYFSGDAHLNPNLLIKSLKSHLLAAGVKFSYQTSFTNYKARAGKISEIELTSPKGKYWLATDQLIMASGSWSEKNAALFNLKLPIQAGKGYSFNIEQNTGAFINTPTILVEARVAVTPLGSQVRFGGTMEIGGINKQINMNRVKGIVKAGNAYYPKQNLKLPPKEEIWYGLRPCSPDGLPYIGQSSQLTNLLIASGHAMMGLSLAPATGHLVADIIALKKPAIQSALLSPERFA